MAYNSLYPVTSPYYNTAIEGNDFLDVMVNRPITVDPTDVYWEITTTYNLRPDLLAYDLYNDSRLWWVFAQRNPDVIEDPIYDFSPGKVIQLPKLSNLKNDLGI